MNRKTGEPLTKRAHELKTPGDHMRYAREIRGYTLFALSRRSGVGEVAINNWENGRHSPTVLNAICVCTVLNISLDEYVGFKRRNK